MILDGASEPLGTAPTSLERAQTPTLDRLAGEGSVIRLRTVAPGLPAGSESAIPGLLGWVPEAPVDRGAVEAAAYGVVVGDDERAFRVDRRDRGDASETARSLAERLPRYRVHHLAAHRMLLVGADPLPELGDALVVWPAGVIPPRTLAQDTVVIGARGAAVGVGRLMGARTIIPPGATGRPGSDLAAKARAAINSIEMGATRLVIHVGAPDEAAHERDAEAKVTAVEAADALLLRPLADALRVRLANLGAGAAALHVCPDHGCDPSSGLHDDAPVPCLRWPFARAPAVKLPDGYVPYDCLSGERLTERAVARLPLTQLASVTPATRGAPAGQPVAA